MFSTPHGLGGRGHLVCVCRKCRGGSFGQARVQFWSSLVLDSAEARRKLIQKKIEQAGGRWTGWWLQCWAQKIPEELMARSWR